MNNTAWFWNIVDARLANVSSDEFVALNELISDAERAEAELNAISAAIGSPRFMDPPDGGGVPLAEQVRRMRNTLELAEASVAGLSSMLLSVQQDNTELRAALNRIAFLRPVGPSRNKLVEQMERIAIEATATLESSGPTHADANSTNEATP